MTAPTSGQPTSGPPRTCGQGVAELLTAYGIRHVFGIPGVHTVELYRGLADDGAPRHVLPRHEQGAAFMADGYARASGRPAACFLITGPGLTNAATPIGQAHSDSVPMLVVSGVNATGNLGQDRNTLHEIRDQRAALAPLCAWNATATAPGNLPPLLARAFTTFTSGRPRPVHIEVPLDVLDERVPEPWQPQGLADVPAPGARELDTAAAMLRAAERPAIVAGGGTVDAGDAIRRLAESAGAPVATTIAAKGVMADDHPLHLGALLPHAPVQDLLRGADVVVALGTELSETDLWADRLALDGSLIRVDLDPVELADDHPADLAIRADAVTTASALADRLGHAADATAARERVAQARSDVATGRGAMARAHIAVLEAIRDALPADAIVASDMSRISYTANEVFPVGRPRRWLHPLGYGTLGYALPAALGAKLAQPDAPVVALAGDGGAMFSIQELATGADEGLPVVLLIWNDRAFGEIREDMTAKGVAPIGVSPTPPDFAALARAFGCAGAVVEDLDSLGEAIAEGLARTVPTVVDIRAEAVAPAAVRSGPE